MKKKLMTVLALVLVIAMSVAGTYAYLTSQASVKNTFTVGSVNITLDETDVDEWGVAVTTATARVDGNEYKLMPGHEYLKDPVVHVTKGSEACYVFVKVKDELNDIEVNDMSAEDKSDWTPSIANQVTEVNGWTRLGEVANVYYKLVNATDAEKGVDLPVFNGFKLTDNADTAAYENAAIIVTAYAIQADGFNTAKAAWEASGFGTTA